jgi:hypothetical protein
MRIVKRIVDPKKVRRLGTGSLCADKYGDIACAILRTSGYCVPEMVELEAMLLPGLMCLERSTCSR